MELRAGQNATAKWYAQTVSVQGQEARRSVEPSVFWCVRSSVSKTDKAFRESVETHVGSIVLASTNLSKLVDIEHKMGKVLYDGVMREIVGVTRSIDGTVVYIALA